MFTGLISELGEVVSLERPGAGMRLTVSAPESCAQLSEGGSVAVNGACLTVVEVGGGQFTADVMNETLRRTSLDGLCAGGRVNIELPLKAGEPLGGHFVQGHVDGVGVICDVGEEGIAKSVRIDVVPELMGYLAEKGSIAVEGVSLTVAAVDESGFEVMLIPETQQRTTLAALQPGSKVNLEVDILAKYVERALTKPREKEEAVR